MSDPNQQTIDRMNRYVEKYREKSGTSAHPDASVTDSTETVPKL